MTTDTIEKLREALKSSPKLFLSWEFCREEVEKTNGPVSIGHLQNIANKKNTFRTGKNAGAPLPRLYPVEASSFYRWLVGKGDRNKK